MPILSHGERTTTLQQFQESLTSTLFFTETRVNSEQMKKEDIQLPVIVEKTLLSPNLSKKTSLNKSVNWVDQLCAVVNLIPVEYYK